MRTPTIKLFRLLLPPISGYCKQERCEHAWPVAHCGRNFSLSSASGLRLESRSAGARSPFSAGCAGLCVFTQCFTWSVLKPGFTTCAHTPKENSTFPHLLRGWIPAREKPCWLCSLLWDFPRRPGSGRSAGCFSCRLQCSWPESAPKVTARVPVALGGRCLALVPVVFPSLSLHAA